MPRKDVLQIKNFSGGVNSYSDPRDLQENEFQILDNAAVDEQGIIRVSGGLELKDNIDLSNDGTDSILSIAGKGLFSHRTDYTYNKSGLNSNLESDGGDTANAWGIVKNNGDGTWAFEQTSTNTNGTIPSEIGANTSFAINYDEYEAAGNYNHGSLTFNNIELKEGTSYTLGVNIVSEMPWNYLGSNIPPRIRLYNPTDSLYLWPSEGFISTSDATHTAICNDNIGNFIETPSSAVTGNGSAADHVTWSSKAHGDGDWTANGNAAILDREAIDDSTPAADNHEQFNSLFGTITTSGAVANGWALELEGTHNTAWWNAGNAATCSPLTVEASTKYLFDAFYFAIDEPCMVRIKKAGTTTYLWDSGILDPQSKWTHISGNTEYPQPIIFETPSGCTSIEIEISVSKDGDIAFFNGFNIRKNVYELSKFSGGGLGTIFPFYNYPNSWANKSSGSVNSSPYMPTAGINPHFKKIRNYELSFSTGYGFTDNKFTLVIDNGVWGVANETGTTVNNIMIDSINLYENNTSTSLNTPEVSSYSSGRGNLIFYNKYNETDNNNNISLYQYKSDSNEYEDITSLFTFPSVPGKTNFNFFKSGSKILFCDENFIDKSLYTFQYNKKTKLNQLSTFNGEGLDIKHLTNNSNDGIDEDKTYDALSNWKDINPSNNDAFLSMISTEVLNWFQNGGHSDSDYDNVGLHINGTGNSFCEHSTDEDGTTVVGTLIIDHDDSNNRFQYNKAASFEDDEQPYAKYITIPSYDIVQALTSTTRVAKITIDLSHWMLWGYSGLETTNGSLYIPKMDIFIDVVHDDVILTANGTTYTGTYQANHHDDTGTDFISTIAHKEVNPHDLLMGYDTEEQTPGTLGYSHYRMDSPDTNMVGGTKRCYSFFKSNEFDTANNRPLRVEFEFPYDFTYTPAGGSATNLTVHATTGTNFQVRIVPVVNDSLDFASQGEIVGRAKGIMSENWTIDKIDIQSWKTSQTGTLSSIFSNIQLNDFAMNMAFETPSEGEPDAWDSDWTPKLTYVNKDGIESAFGQFNFPPVKNTDVIKCPFITFAYDVSSPILRNVKLIKCYMSSSRNPNYNLQFTIDVEKKTIKSSTSPHESEAIQENNIMFYQLASKNLLIPNEIDSYESQTGVLSENALSPGKLTATFKTAVVANNTLYAGNILQDGVRYPDRMLKSPIGKSPLLPSTNFIDVAINDGDEITSLQFYKDRLLQFKKNRLYIISTSQDYEYLQDTIENVGVQQDSQITMTPYGVVWVNTRGCYLYDGQNVNNLTDNKIAYKEWKDSESSWEIDEKYGASIHYLRKEDKLIVYGATDSLDNIQEIEGYNFANPYANSFDYSINKQYLRQLGYQYDFKSKSWINITSFLENIDGDYNTINEKDGRLRVAPPNNMITNFSYDENGDSIFLMKPSNDILKWDDNPKHTSGDLDLSGFEDNTTPNSVHRDFRIITKDYDFGAPSVKKKIHKVYVTFKSTHIESNKMKKVMQKQDLYKSSNVGVYYAINGTNTWTEFSETKSDNYGTKGLISTDSETTTTTSSSTSSTSNTVSVTSASNIKVGYVLKIGEEQMLVKSISGTTITVDRNYNLLNQATGSPNFGHGSGATVTISTGDWIVAELKPASSINNIDSFKLKFETKKRSNVDNDDNGVPSGFMINDISVIYRTKNVR